MEKEETTSKLNCGGCEHYIKDADMCEIDGSFISEEQEGYQDPIAEMCPYYTPREHIDEEW